MEGLKSGLTKRCWSPNIAANKERDARNKAQLEQRVWTVGMRDCRPKRSEDLFLALTGEKPQSG